MFLIMYEHSLCFFSLSQLSQMLIQTIFGTNTFKSLWLSQPMLLQQLDQLQFQQNCLFLNKQHATYI